MAETSGFFQSVNGDRKYGAAFLAAREAALASNGVHNDELSVTQGGGMTINVAAGRAFINGYFYQNDGAKALNISAADATLSRIDAVMLRLNLNAREILAMVSKGTPSASPVAPAPIRSGSTYELKLAEIRVAPGTTEITLDMITDTRLNSEVCGIVSGTIGKLDTAEFYKTMQASFDKFMADLEDALSEDAAGNLLTQINDLKDDVNVTLTHAKSGTVHALTGLSGRTGIISAVFKATAAYAERNTFTVDGTVYAAKLQTGEALPDGAFASGTVVGVILDTAGKTVNFKSGGGNSAEKYHITHGQIRLYEDNVQVSYPGTLVIAAIEGSGIGCWHSNVINENSGMAYGAAYAEEDGEVKLQISKGDGYITIEPYDAWIDGNDYGDPVEYVIISKEE